MRIFDIILAVLVIAMLMKVDLSKPMFRLLYANLYNRVLSFAPPGKESEEAVKARFMSLVAGDERVQLLIDLDPDGTVKAHCLFLLNPLANGLSAFVEQVESDNGHNESFVKDCIAFVESIPSVNQIAMSTSEKKYRAFKKKYGFETSHVLMVRPVKRD
jgi:hypothetical protein